MKKLFKDIVTWFSGTPAEPTPQPQKPEFVDWPIPKKSEICLRWDSFVDRHPEGSVLDYLGRAMVITYIAKTRYRVDLSDWGRRGRWVADDVVVDYIDGNGVIHEKRFQPSTVLSLFDKHNQPNQ